MEEKQRMLIILEGQNNWRRDRKSFSLGVNLVSEDYRDYREFIIAIHLGFWSFFVGFSK